MDHVLTEYGLCLSYLCDPASKDELDQDRILEDLSDDTPAGDPLAWLNRYLLADYDHLVLVTNRASGKHLGFLAANNGSTEREDFLLLESAFITSTARGQNLMRRMIAFAMLGIAGLYPVPSVLVARTRNPLCYRIMRGMAQRFAEAVIFPDPEAAAINFRAATLARRIAHAIGPQRRVPVIPGTMRDEMLLVAGADNSGSHVREPQVSRLWGQPMLAVLDLRAQDEASIVEDARRLYRAR